MKTAPASLIRHAVTALKIIIEILGWVNYIEAFFTHITGNYIVQFDVYKWHNPFHIAVTATSAVEAAGPTSTLSLLLLSHTTAHRVVGQL